MEIYKDISGYEGVYQVSSYGNVKSLKRQKWNGYAMQDVPKRVLKKAIDKTGYYSISLSKNGKYKSFRIHKLVAETFLNHTACGYKLVIDHIDNNPLNNNLDNLQLITHKENCTKDKKSYLNQKK